MTRFGAQLARTLLPLPLAWLLAAAAGVPRWQLELAVILAYAELLRFVLVGEREEGC